MKPSQRITFGMIVLNGEPFTRYNLRSIYPWAHQIIVVEGACKAAVAVASSTGHSTDGTLEVLRRFQADEDPEKKLIIVTAEDEGHSDGFWPGEKHEMSQAYAKRATGNYLWQVDVDEFYKEDDMRDIIALLENGSTQISFPMIQFWGGIDFRENGEFLSVHFKQVHRIFAWGKDYSYTTHRPPTVIDNNGIDLRLKKSVGSAELKNRKIFMYHYSFLLPKQVREKCSYYSKVDWAAYHQMEIWAERSYFNFQTPFSVCDVQHVPLSWIEEYYGPHPKQILKMISSIKDSLHPNIELRDIDDILSIIRTPSYKVGRLIRIVWVFLLPFRNTIWVWLAQWKILGKLRRSVLILSKRVDKNNNLRT